MYQPERLVGGEPARLRALVAGARFAPDPSAPKRQDDLLRDAPLRPPGVRAHAQKVADLHLAAALLPHLALEGRDEVLAQLNLPARGLPTPAVALHEQDPAPASKTTAVTATTWRGW